MMLKPQLWYLLPITLNPKSYTLNPKLKNSEEAARLGTSRFCEAVGSIVLARFLQGVKECFVWRVGLGFKV